MERRRHRTSRFIVVAEPYIPEALFCRVCTCIVARGAGIRSCMQGGGCLSHTNLHGGICRVYVYICICVYIGEGGRYRGGKIVYSHKEGVLCGKCFFGVMDLGLYRSHLCVIASLWIERRGGVRSCVNVWYYIIPWEQSLRRGETLGAGKNIGRIFR